MKPVYLLPSLLCCACLVLLAGCNRGKQHMPSQQPPEVGVITAQPRNVPLTVNLVGRLSAYRQADVRARVAGILEKRVYNEGTEVKKGQLLFQIDPRQLQASLNAAKAQLAQAQATYTNAHVSAKRARDLGDKGYVSQADLDTTQANERAAAAAVQAARASVDAASINLSYASVTSPIDGRAGQQQVTEGALVGNGTPTLLTTVDQLDPLYVNFTGSLSELDKLRNAQSGGDVSLSAPNTAKIQITFSDGTSYPHLGTVDFAATSVDPATGAVKFRAVLPNPERRLLPGSYVNITAMVGERHGVFLIPQPGVLRDPGGTYVLIVDKDGKVAQRNVTTSGMKGNDWIVTFGLTAGARVIVSGTQIVRVGTPATTVPWHQPPAKAAATGQPAPNADSGK